MLVSLARVFPKAPGPNGLSNPSISGRSSICDYLQDKSRPSPKRHSTRNTELNSLICLNFRRNMLPPHKLSFLEIPDVKCDFFNLSCGRRFLYMGGRPVKKSFFFYYTIFFYKNQIRYLSLSPSPNTNWEPALKKNLTL